MNWELIYALAANFAVWGAVILLMLKCGV